MPAGRAGPNPKACILQPTLDREYHKNARNGKSRVSLSATISIGGAVKV
jgi:hypothetical protein